MTIDPTPEAARLDELDRSRTTLAHLIADAFADGRMPRPSDVDAYRDVTAEYDRALGLAPLR